MEVILAPRVGFEPTTLRLTAECSTAELSRIICHNTHIITHYLERTTIVLSKSNTDLSS